MDLVWKRLDEIEHGDILIVLRRMPDKGEPLLLPSAPKDPPKDKAKLPTHTTEEFCQMFGYILGDGCVSMDKKGSRLCITPSYNICEKSAYKKIFKNLFDYDLKRNVQNGYESFVCCSYKVWPATK